MTKSTDFNYYEANSVYGALFFQFPKVLMYGEQYKHLSSDAKLAYMVLKDRLEYSLRNSWLMRKITSTLFLPIKNSKIYLIAIIKKSSK